MDRRWKLLEHRLVIVDQPVEGRAPRRQCDHVDERQRGHVAAVEQVRAQGGRAADVVRDQRRALEPPVLEQRGQASPVAGERDVLTGALVRGAEAEQVEHMDAEALRQPRSDPPPRPRRPRRAVDQHHGRPLAEPVPGDLALLGGEALT